MRPIQGPKIAPDPLFATEISLAPATCNSNKTQTLRCRLFSGFILRHVKVTPRYTAAPTTYFTSRQAVQNVGYFAVVSFE